MGDGIFKLKSDSQMLAALKTLPKDINFNFIDEEFDTLLTLTPANNLPLTAKYLLTETNAVVDVTLTPHKTNAVHIAASEGNTAVLRVLLDACKRDFLLRQDAYGETALLKAITMIEAESLCLATLQLLIARNPKALHIKNKDGILPVESALAKHRYNMVNCL